MKEKENWKIWCVPFLRVRIFLTFENRSLRDTLLTDGIWILSVRNLNLSELLVFVTLVDYWGRPDLPAHHWGMAL